MPAVTRSRAATARPDANGTARAWLEKRRVAQRERALREREAQLILERLADAEVVKYNMMVYALKALYPGGVLDERASLFCKEHLYRTGCYVASLLDK
jgi:hypothetical protein